MSQADGSPGAQAPKARRRLRDRPTWQRVVLAIVAVCILLVLVLYILGAGTSSA